MCSVYFWVSENGWVLFWPFLTALSDACAFLLSFQHSAEPGQQILHMSSSLQAFCILPVDIHFG